MTNREIAQQLFLSPKTVDVHLTRIYAKLGVPRRADLAELLARPRAGSAGAGRAGSAGAGRAGSTGAGRGPGDLD
jgi:hypothetical protein